MLYATAKYLTCHEGAANRNGRASDLIPARDRQLPDPTPLLAPHKIIAPMC
jgi:hypothetical protein